MKLRNKINLYTAFLFALLLLLINITVYYSFNKLILDSELSIANKEMQKVSENVGKSIGIIPEDTLLRSYVPINGMIQIVTKNNKNFSAVTSLEEQDLSKRKPVFYTNEVTKTIKYQSQPLFLILCPLFYKTEVLQIYR